MSAYGIAHLRNPNPHPDILEYLERIQQTLDPFSGRFVIHGGTLEVLEGSWAGTIVVIEFPGMSEARSWYESPAYREILPLRTTHIDGDVILVDGVEPGHDSAKMAADMRRAQGEGRSRRLAG
jgi:uncharacterized protein (DUF1330 family)